jgi:hypothetical protein
VRLIAEQRVTGAVPGAIPRFILTGAAIHVAAGLAAFFAVLWTGQTKWVELFFAYPATLFLIELAAIELRLCRRCYQHFTPSQPARRAWLLITLAAGSGLAGAILGRVLSLDSPLNPLSHAQMGWSPDAAVQIRAWAAVCSGPLRMAALAAALGFMIHVCRKSGMLWPLQWKDWCVLGGAGVFLLLEGLGGAPLAFPTLNKVLMFGVLAEALLVGRSAIMMGRGPIARCWQTLATALLLTLFASLAAYAANHGLLPWPVEWVTWSADLLAAAAFALVPAFQAEALDLARREPVPALMRDVVRAEA